MDIFNRPLLKAVELQRQYSAIYDLSRYRADFILSRIMYDYDIRAMGFDFKVDKFCGMLISDHLGTSITWNTMHPTSRRNFTIAHELGHFFLHLGESDHFFDRSEELLDDYCKEREQQANAFAAKLLLPDEIIRRNFEFRSSFYGIAKRTGVSSECLKWRITSLLHNEYNLTRNQCADVIEDYKVHSENKIARQAAIFDIVFSKGDLTSFKKRTLAKLGDQLYIPGGFNHISNISFIMGDDY